MDKSDLRQSTWRITRYKLPRILLFCTEYSLRKSEARTYLHHTIVQLSLFQLVSSQGPTPYKLFLIVAMCRNVDGTNFARCAPFLRPTVQIRV